MLRFGPEAGPVVIAALPLFEEANRTRAAMVDTLRRLAAFGIAGALPDLPGTNESLVETIDATLIDWQTAFAAAAAALPGPVHAIAWRGGALVDLAANLASRWHLAPATGAEFLRDLRRAQAASGDSELFAGNRLSEAMIEQLEAAHPQTVRGELVEPLPFSPDKQDDPSTSSGRAEKTRTLRLATDPRPADRHLPGPPLWRAAEPTTDAGLQAALAADITEWIATCER